MKIQVKVNGKDIMFLIDTGIGPTVVSKDLANELALNQVGIMHGNRMSGQGLEIPLVEVPSIEVAGLIRKDVVVGIFDTSGFPPDLDDIKGILSIGFFKDKTLTVDYSNHSLTVAEAPLDGYPQDNGTRVPIDVEYNGPSVSLFVRVKLPNGKTGKFEVDTGSDVLIMNLNLMAELGISPEDREVKIFTGSDETGNKYKRYLAKIKGNILLDGSPELVQENPRVVFQDIIYDGLIGHDFLKRYTVSYNLDKREMIFYKR